MDKVLRATTITHFFIISINCNPLDNENPSTATHLSHSSARKCFPQLPSFLPSRSPRTPLKHGPLPNAHPRDFVATIPQRQTSIPFPIPPPSLSVPGQIPALSLPPSTSLAALSVSSSSATIADEQLTLRKSSVSSQRFTLSPGDSSS